MSLDRVAAARLIGMKPSEVLAVEALPGGRWAVTTHDQQVVEAGPVGGVRVELGGKDVTDMVSSVVAVDEQPVDEGLAEALAGTAKDVLAWVGNDPGKAAAAREAESARETPRVKLLHDLDKISKAGR